MINTDDFPIPSKEPKNQQTCLRLLKERLAASSTFTRTVPVTGFTITIAPSINSLVLEPAGTLAAGTINLTDTPYDGQQLSISSSQIVTTLTLAGNGATIVGATSTLAANVAVRYLYVAATDKWYKQ